MVRKLHRPCKKMLKLSWRSYPRWAFKNIVSMNKIRRTTWYWHLSQFIEWCLNHPNCFCRILFIDRDPRCERKSWNHRKMAGRPLTKATPRNWNRRHCNKKCALFHYYYILSGGFLCLGGVRGPTQRNLQYWKSFLSCKDPIFFWVNGTSLDFLSLPINLRLDFAAKKLHVSWSSW